MKLDLNAGAINTRRNKQGAVVCWICEAPDGLHMHHLIPQAYGGRDGPQIGICSICHAKVHEAGDSGKDFQGLVPILWPNASRQALNSALTCAKMIVVAKERTKNDPNKSIAFNTRLPASTANQLKALASAYGKSQSWVVQKAIESLYTRHLGR